MLTVPNELALTESRTMRAATVDRTDVLDKVKALLMLPDGLHLTTEMVADYYEVGPDAIESVVRRNRQELATNGMHTLRGAELREFETVSLTVSKRQALRLFPRRTIVNVGQLLVGSEISKRVRTTLLDEIERPEPATDDAAAIPRNFPEALRAFAAELERNEQLSAEVAELDATNRKLSPKAARADKYEANPGITPTVFHKTWFPEVSEREFFEHLYRKDYLIDQRNTIWDERKQEWKDGLEHRHPAAKGKRYFYLQPAIDRKGWRRERTLVIPGDAEHDLVAALERDGLPSIDRPAIPGAEVLHMPRQMRGGA